VIEKAAGGVAAQPGEQRAAIRRRLVALGWSEIETVDDDLGRSPAGGVARAGFDRMVLPRQGWSCRGPGGLALCP
jgi:hypothetical protein